MQKKVKQWLSQRFQYQAPKTLKQNDVLVFIYQQGFLYLILILITFIAGVNYANNLILGFCFLISAILCISFYLTFKQLHALNIEIISPEVGRVNEVFSVKFILKQPTKMPKYLYFKYADQFQQVLFDELQQSIELHLIAEQRGLYQFPQIQMYSTYPLGLVRAWTYFYIQKEVWIAPQPKALNQNFYASASLGQPDLDEFHELRNFKVGDSLQAVSWKQVARGQGMYIKQFEDQSDAQTLYIEYAQMPSSDHEEKLSLIMGLVDQCEQHKIPYSIRLPQIEIVQGCGEQQYLQVQQQLARA
ncbi:DUF58 domain-containing protein [Acinetobacter sp. ANC 4648]|uniref:DUF58 domain-containing protein n=1 Tax=Acinetobacter sp. ANC 4648 TaxID=1977875 RepID=UPI000A335219|nr:DUF58 domain-containing protein [Acinetobacter sp. ANC 4648]OTG84059.1 DUF58 domain-containing protein [Acinetobacter sp. ANC 4648]